MNTGAGHDPASSDTAALQTQLAGLVARLSGDWSASQAEDGSDPAVVLPEGLGLADARTRCAQALQDLLDLLGASSGTAAWLATEAEGEAAGSRSLVASLQALHALLQDPMASLPGQLATALVLTQERLADLRLQQLLAAEDPNWTRTLLQTAETPAMALPLPVPSESVPPTEQAIAGRDWWDIPMEGLTGSNQMFLLETRELLRSADLSFQALLREPGDYGEQMVLCRSFQAVSVAAASMGLHRVAKLAGEGEARFDALLDHGGLCDSPSLQATEDLLSALFRELMELVGEPVAEVAAPAPQPAEPTRESAPEPEPQRLQEPLPEPASESAQAVEPEPEPPPWWWATDWSAWAQPAPTTAASAIGTEALMQVLQTAAEASETAATVLRLPATQLQGWADRLRSVGHEDAARKALIGELEEAACVPLESWSVALFRTARRVAREAGQSVDFDMEGASVRADAAFMQHLMPRLEEWIGLRVAQSLGQPLRLKATHEGSAVGLHLADGHLHPWPERVMTEAQHLAAWFAARGGAIRADASGWLIAMPVVASRMPILPVHCGSLEAHVPALWVVSHQTIDRQVLGQALEAGSLEHQGSTWPVVNLGALLRQEPADPAVGQVLWMCQGDKRLALVVDGTEPVTTARPLPWPAPLVGLKSRSGMWGLAACEQDRLATVIDPFALYERFGAAARVLARTRSRRAGRGAISP